jgi:protease-4
MQFFKIFFANLLAILIALMVGVPLLLIVGFGILASAGSRQSEVRVAEGSILHLRLDQPIAEHAEEDPFRFDLPTSSPLGVFAASSSLGLYELSEAIGQAQRDERIQGIYLQMPGTVQAGWASLSTLRERLLDFQSSGKFIYAYSELYDERSYYLASVADSLYLPPVGYLEFNGLASNPVFFTGLFEKLEVEPKIFRVGSFKSAVEPFFRKSMSDSSRLQTERYLSGLWSVFAEEVALARGLSRARVDELARTLVLADGRQALAAGLADRCAFEDEVLRQLALASGKLADEKPSLLSYGKYRRAGGKNKPQGANKIRVIIAEGDITGGKSGSGSAGSETLVAELRKAREDAKVKAVVLRINSPGGSALASDLIAREVALCSQAKPLAASMGDLAASGGYYIAAPSRRIFARKNTLTGSIGIFGLLFNTQQLFSSKLGITFDQVETHPSANVGNPNFPMSPAEEALLQRNVERGYGDFVRVVQQGRGFADSLAVDRVAQGRVWSGEDALGLRLVDEWGGLDAAIAWAAREAGVENDYRVELRPRSTSPFERLLENMQEQARRQQLGLLYEDWKAWEALRRQLPASGLYALMPPQGEIR